MADRKLEKAYELLEKKRLANVARNAAEGRTMNMTGTPLNDEVSRAVDLKQAMADLRNKGKVTNLESTIKATPTDTIGIKPEVRNKSKFFNLDQKMGIVDDVADDAAKLAGESSILKNAKGFAKGVLPAIGLGGAALAAMGIMNKAQAGELKDAAVDTADLATDYIPVVNELKMALKSEGLGKGSDNIEGLQPFVQDQPRVVERPTYDELNQVSKDAIKNGRFPKLLNRFNN